MTNIVSVCMASYNGAEFIERQIFSILNQLGDYDELIISDDGSTDNTIQLVKKIGDHRISLVNNEKRRGPMGNFENALQHASGQKILLADQDDVWLPGKVEQVSDLLNQYDLVLTDCEVVNQNGTTLHPSFFKHRGSRAGFWPNVYRNSYIGCCMAFRREVLTYVLPIPPEVHMHDWWIGLLVEAKGTVTLHPVPLIRYVRHGGNASLTGEKGYSLPIKVINRLIMLANVTRRLMAKSRS